MKKLRNIGTAFAVAGSSALFLAAGSAHAALPEGVKASLDQAQADGIEVAGMVLALIIAIAAFKYIRRAL